MDLKIEKLVYGGDGLARLPGDEAGRGKTVFVPFALQGERVEAVLTEHRRGFARARIDKILERSSERRDPACPYFARCGGCHYQHAAYDHQLAIKSAVLKENLRRMAKLELPCELQVHASPPWNYRNRTRLRLEAKPKFTLGYYRFRSHQLLAVEECPISSPLINHAITTLWELGASQPLGSWVREIEFFANADDTQLLIELFVNTAQEPLASSAADRVGKRQTAADQTPDKRERRQLWPGQLLDAIRGAISITVLPCTPDAWAGQAGPLAELGAGRLQYQTAQASYRVSAGSFFQTNRFLIDELVKIVTAERWGHTVLDLYAGVGLFSTIFDRQFERVIAVESSAPALADLAYNAPHVKAVRASVDQYLKNASGTVKPDLLIVDPPRGGVGDRVAEGLAALGATRLTYVSCDPATLARDLIPLLRAGYQVAEAHLLDLFPQTYHLESVLHLVRN